MNNIKQVNLIGTPNRYIEQDLAEFIDLRNDLAERNFLGPEFCTDLLPRIEITQLGLICVSEIELEAFPNPSIEVIQQANKLKTLAVFFERYSLGGAKNYDEFGFRAMKAESLCRGLYERFAREIVAVGYYRDANRNRSSWFAFPKNDKHWK